MKRRILYLGLSLLLFVTEIVIAVYFHDGWIRPFLGDVLVVMLIYSAVQTLLAGPPARVAGGVLLFACLIETLQAVDYVALLGLQDHRWISVIMGRTFSWGDFAAYITGYLVIRLLEGRGDPSTARPGPGG